MNKRTAWINNRRRLAALFPIVACAIALTFAGCRDAGIGGTGEIVVPRETLRDIEGADPGKFAVTPATTVPSTQPSTRASTQPLKDVQLTIEEVRQLALQNNLDLK